MEKFFKYKEHGSNFWREVVGGIITFVAMIYILPTNAKILSDLGMNSQGVFAMTALVSAAMCILMGLVANYPIALSAGMGLNAFLTYTIGHGMGFSWQESMILLAVSGIVFFVISLTPAREYLMNKIPNDLKYIITGGLGAFLILVGLRSSNIVVFGNGLPEFGNLADISVLIPFLGIFIIIALMFVKNKYVSSLAIPIGVVLAAIVGISVNYGVSGGNNASLPAFSSSWGISGVDEVLFFGFLTGNDKSFGEMLTEVFTNPISYLAIFSLVFVNLFDTTATLLAVGKNSGLINEKGELVNGQRAIVADAVGSLVCAPLGTSTVTSFAESNIGVSFGARTGLMAVTVGALFLLSAFVYPIFSVFSSWSVMAPALICVGGTIFASSVKDIKLSDYRTAISYCFTLLFIILTYSLSTGLGIGIICFTLINLVSGRKNENNPALYIISGLFILSFALTALLNILMP